MSKDVKNLILEKIKMLRSNQQDLGKDIQELDKLIGLKKSDYLRLDGAIQGLEATLNDLRAEEKKEIELDEGDEE